MIYKYRIPPSMIDGNHYYVDEQGLITNASGRVKPQHFNEAMRNHTSGSCYQFIRYGKHSKMAHKLICAARWGLPRQGQECHHLNGNKFDNRPMNLIWLSKARHRLYDRRLKALKTLITNVSIFTRRDFIRFARMSESTFSAMLAKYTRREPLDPAAEPNKYYDPFIERD